MEKIKTVEILDRVFEETYTAHIQRNGTTWMGWIPDVAKVKCEALTEKALLKVLETKLHEAACCPKKRNGNRSLRRT